MLLNIDLSTAKEMSTAEALMELGRLAAPNQTKEYQKRRAEIQLDTYILPHLGSDATCKEGEGRIPAEDGGEMLARGVRVCKGQRQGPLRQQADKAGGGPDGGAVQQRIQVLRKGHKVPRREDHRKGGKLSVRTNINPDALTGKILYSMGTGSWPAGQTGISQVLDRVNLTGTLAHLRRVKSPLSKKHPHYKARDVHGTYLGKLCPSETAEGTDVGLTKYLAIMAKITVGADTRLSRRSSRSRSSYEVLCWQRRTKSKSLSGWKDSSGRSSPARASPRR